MDGFKVDTTALSQSSKNYQAIGNSLQESVSDLQAIQEMLKTQTLAAGIAELISSAINHANVAAIEARELGEKCVQIADVYETTERNVEAIVESLPCGTGLFSNLSVNQNTTLTPSSSLVDGYNIFNLEEPFVDTSLRPAEPIAFSSNRLPSEGWLMDRAMRYQQKKGIFNNE